MPEARPLWTMRPQRLLGVALAVIGVATLLGISSAAVMYAGRLAAGRPMPFEEALVRGVSDWYLWPALTPLVLWLARRFRISGDRWLSSGLVHMASGTALALVEIAGAVELCLIAGVPTRYPTFGHWYLAAIAGWFQFAFLVYWVMVVGVHAIDHYRRLQHREVEAAELRSQVASAQLRALRMQLHPHFLFNTLHTIGVYAREHRVDEAVDLIAELADLLRVSLDQGTDHEVLLRDELEFIARYLGIERKRFGDRLRVRLDAPPETARARVPAMILQPLVENAIRHGIAARPAAGLIEIEAQQADGMLHLRVRDDGPGFTLTDQDSSQQHVGLSNTRDRLSRLYGKRQRIEITNHVAGGAVVALSLPFHTEPMRPEGG